jgi:hypothetical protein
VLNNPPEPIGTLLKAIVLFTDQRQSTTTESSFSDLLRAGCTAWTSFMVQIKVLNSAWWVAEQPVACILPSMLTSLPPTLATRPPAASTEESRGTGYTKVYREYTRSSHLSRFLAVCSYQALFSTYAIT